MGLLGVVPRIQDHALKHADIVRRPAITKRCSGRSRTWGTRRLRMLDYASWSSNPSR